MIRIVQANSTYRNSSVLVSKGSDPCVIPAIGGTRLRNYGRAHYHRQLEGYERNEFLARREVFPARKVAWEHPDATFVSVTKFITMVR